MVRGLLLERMGCAGVSTDRKAVGTPVQYAVIGTAAGAESGMSAGMRGVGHGAQTVVHAKSF